MISRQPHSVLIVEDERIVARDIQLTLRDLGYDAFAIASSADEAMDRASERCPDLVLMDIRIKGHRDGIDTAQILRTKYDIPIVYLTAHADEATIERAKKSEPHGYLLKPVKTAELRSVVEVSLYKHEMEKRLREREHWFSTTLRSIADAVITVDLAGNVTFMNSAAEALTGVNAAAAAGTSVHKVLQLQDQESGKQNPLLQALHEGRSVELKEGNLLNLSTGALQLINDSVAPVVDEGTNQTLGAVMVFRDVTDQTRLQKQLELADRLASLGTMAAGVAHEVNNPLAVVLANSGFLVEELNELRFEGQSNSGSKIQIDQRIQEMSQALTELRSAASRIGLIVSGLGAFARPLPQTSTDVDVVRCVKWAVRTTTHEFRHRAKLVTHLHSVPLIKGDEARLGQVFINLLVNAAQAISPGRADCNEVSIETRSDLNDCVVIEIRDTGGGISKDALKRIFEPFFTTKAVGLGTGLGLSICHGIITSLGGEIQVESELGHGTVMRVLLPATAPEATLVPVSIAQAISVSPIYGRILVIDDEDMVLRAIKRILRKHEVYCVESAWEALTLIDQGQQFDLILSDLMMPTMTGIEFYKILLSRKPEIARRVVFMSGGAITAYADEFLQSVPNLKIEKPFEGNSLQEVIQQLFVKQIAEQNSPKP